MSSFVPTVLFVDDEPNVLAGIRLTLRGRSFRIHTAQTALDALDYLSRERVGVVVSDEHMPGMDGTTFLAEVRRRHPSAVRMVLSGSSDPARISRAVNEAAPFRYLLKPCTPADLILAVDQSLESHLAQQGRPPVDGRAIDLDRAIADGHVLFQPIFRAARGDLFAHEALLRLPADVRATPIDLLEAADREDRLWSVERAIRRLIVARLPERPTGSLVFINVHPKSLLDPQLYDARDVLAPHARSVVFEITERASITDVPDLRDRVGALRRLGYRVAIDDLGSGYSGLTTFTHVLPDFVKFDRELVDGIHAAEAKRKLVQSFATVCTGLRIETIAEGIEDDRDLAVIRKIGCGYAQGYLLARPESRFWDMMNRPDVDRLSPSLP